jgi:hypothetical protein
MEVSDQLQCSASAQNKVRPYPLDSKLGGTQSQSGCRSYEKNLLPLLGFKPDRELWISNGDKNPLARLPSKGK